MKTIAEKSLDLTNLFEAEVLVRLMLRSWLHPLRDDDNFANDLLESASEVLRASIQGEKFIEGLPPASMNLIAALWYVEYCAVEAEEAATPERSGRQEWLASVRQALPSCFCDPSDLNQP